MNLNRIALFYFGMQLGIITALGTPYRCAKCDFTTEDPGLRLVHIAREHGYWCCFRDKVRYKNATAFRKHIATKHHYFVCTDCNLRIFKTEKEYQQHFQKYHSKLRSSSPFSDEDKSYRCSYCFPQFGKQTVLLNEWELEMHCWHRHGTLKQFFLTVSPRNACCKPYYGKIIGCETGETKGDAWEDIKCFSEHVYEKHENLCLLCEQKISTPSDELWFRRKEFVPGFVFEQVCEGSFLSENRKTGAVCPCGQPLPFNAKSTLFQLRIDLLPFGSGLDETTRPYACMTDGTKDILSAFSTETSKETPPSEGLKSFLTDNDTGEGIPTKPNSKPWQSPSLSTKSIDATLTSIDDKKHKNFHVSDTNVVPPTDNETNVKSFENL